MARAIWNPAAAEVTPSRHVYRRQIPSSLQSSDVVDQIERTATPPEYRTHGHPLELLMLIASPNHRLHQNTLCAVQARSTERPIRRTQWRNFARTLPHKGQEPVEHFATINHLLYRYAFNSSPFHHCRLPNAEQLTSATVFR